MAGRAVGAADVVAHREQLDEAAVITYDEDARSALVVHEQSSASLLSRQTPFRNSVGRADSFAPVLLTTLDAGCRLEYRYLCGLLHRRGGRDR